MSSNGGGGSRVGAAVGVVVGFLALVGVVSAIWYFYRRPRRIQRNKRQRREAVDLVEELPADDSVKPSAPAPPHIANYLPRAVTNAARAVMHPKKLSFDDPLVPIDAPVDVLRAPPKDVPVSPTITSSEGASLDRASSFWNLWASPRRSPSGGSSLAFHPTVPSDVGGTPSNSLPDGSVLSPATASIPLMSASGGWRQHDSRNSTGLSRSGSRPMSPTPTDAHDVDVDMTSEAGVPAVPPMPTARWEMYTPRASPSSTPRASISEKPESQASPVAQSQASRAPREPSCSFSPRRSQQRAGSPSRSATSPTYPPPPGKRRRSLRAFLPSYDASVSVSPISSTSRRARPSPNSFTAADPAPRTNRTSGALPPAYSPPHSPIRGTVRGDEDVSSLVASAISYDSYSPLVADSTTPSSTRGRPLPRLPPSA
ncbi:hypothetical protein K488DRAFT_83251 [Vararia minispora EC-137]|uniref:Uncharacterized protein n=1 Tax=Vararia minispora EC-137 TaxID=1314806 RepID=A0ACB8QU57_9AGAM|nr:hypothetical protein K488DRAFT_83251 [Vararia minispora EC-137]